MVKNGNQKTTFCPLLIKLTSWPKWLNKKISVSDVLFKSSTRYVLVDTENISDKPLIIDTELPLMRVCKKVLKELDNQELAFVFQYVDLLQEMTYLESEISEEDYQNTIQSILIEKFGEQCYDKVFDLFETYDSTII